MATVRKRTMVTVSDEVKSALDTLAKREKKSVSKVTAELLEFALRIREDIYLNEIAHERMSQSFNTVSHDDLWK